MPEVHKCYGCKHYLSGDGFDCKKKCPRTEDGTTQVICAIEYVSKELEKTGKEWQRLFEERESLWELLGKREKKKCLK